MTRPPHRARRFLRRHRSLGTIALIVMTAAIASPLGALASHQFSDVPNTNTYHADIDALADAGVTTGCGNGTTFCPSAFVTREQMAAFMNRLGALGAGKVPVVNADKLDGLDSNAFVKGPVQAWREIGASGQPGFTPFCFSASLCVAAWENYGPSHNSTAFYKDPLGIVRLKGIVRWVNVTERNFECDQLPIFTLPTGYRPAKITIAPAFLTADPFRVDVLPDGNVVLCPKSSLGMVPGLHWVSIDGIAFRAAQ